jgi:cytidylate kinase
MNSKFYITIGRQLGSGGREIGEKLAKELGIDYYDKELIEIASQKSGLGKEFFEQADEKTSHTIFGGYFEFSSTMISNYANNYLSNEMLFKIQSDVIRSLAERGSCLFVGRCADYVLKDLPGCLNLFVCADRKDRIKRVAEKELVPESKAADIIDKTDKKRAGYYNYYSNKEWGAAESYNICINSSMLGIEGTVQLLKEIVKKRFSL